MKLQLKEAVRFKNEELISEVVVVSIGKHRV